MSAINQVQNKSGDLFDIQDKRLDNCTETANGTYVWQCKIVNGVPTYGWAKLEAYIGSGEEG